MVDRKLFSEIKNLSQFGSGAFVPTLLFQWVCKPVNGGAEFQQNPHFILKENYMSSHKCSELIE